MNHMNQSNARHTITLDDSTFHKLRSKGNFGETYADIILRLIRNADDTWQHLLKEDSDK
jgi:hypothetical protein